MIPLTETELELLLKLLLRLFETSKDTKIKRIGKNLFNVLTKSRFSTYSIISKDKE